MYSVNGSYAAGKGMSEYHLNDGDTLYLRFTLAYGKVLKHPVERKEVCPVTVVPGSMVLIMRRIINTKRQTEKTRNRE